MTTLFPILFDLVIIGAFGLFMVESFREKEYRAPWVGLSGVAVGLILMALILWVPTSRPGLTVLFVLLGLAGLACLIPARPNRRVLDGSAGWVVGEVERQDERDIVFARNRSMPPDEEKVRAYYEDHPEWKEIDAKRRVRGGPLGQPGAIDKGYRPNVSMIASAFMLPGFVGPHADATPLAESPPADLDPATNTKIVKGWARHLGADLVGVCRVDLRWAYSRRGEIYYQNWDDWGRELEDPPPYAVVIATEMDRDLCGAGPHTPCAVESAAQYAKGAFITTILARWFSLMGYRGVADHNRHYRTLMVPLAVDAGLGEMGRHGYLIAPGYGARVRVFAALTDMPLIPDRPLSIGVDEFCRKCKKCAETCPSQSIAHGAKTVHKGVEKWKVDAESCFAYWGAVGTDCSICMGVCPFSRPNRFMHNVVRWFVGRTWAGQNVFPVIDNFLYGKKWRPRPEPAWVEYPRGREARRVQ